MSNQIKPMDTDAGVIAAYERVKADFARLRVDELVQVNLDIPTAVTTIIGVLPEVAALRPRIEKELVAFDLAEFDKLEDYAWALSYAHTMFLMATQPPDDLPVLNAEATKLRDRLLIDARSLAQHRLVDDGQLEKLKGFAGYKNLAQDLQILSFALQANWANIQGKTPTTAEDLQTALRLSARLTRVVGLREQGPQQLAEATERRLRAFTLTIRVYEEARQTIGYLLRSRPGEADTIIPSLYTGKTRRKQETEIDTPVPTPPAHPPTEPAVATNPPAIPAQANTPQYAAGSNPFMTP